MKESIHIGLLAVPEVHSSALFGALDIFSTAGLRWDGRTHCVSGASRFRISVVAASRDPVTAWNGVVIRPDLSIRDEAGLDVVFIPSIGSPAAWIPELDTGMAEWFRQIYARGAILAASCSGALLLAQSGLLNGQKATTHWAYARSFRKLHPEVDLEPDRALVFSGDRHRIITGGGGSLWTDLVLYLIARLVGQEAAVQTSKLYLIDWARDDQLPYASLETKLQQRDADIRKAQSWIAEHMTDPQVLAQAKAESGLSNRTFERRFKAATGVAPIRYIQQMRVELAKEKLERSDTPVDDIAFETGYNDPTSFRRLFVRLVGVTPSVYRKRFGLKWSDLPPGPAA